MSRAIQPIRLSLEAQAIARRRAADAHVPIATAVSVLVLRGDAAFRLADSVAALLDKRLAKISDDIAGLRAALDALQAPTPAPTAPAKKKPGRGKYDHLPEAIRLQFEAAEREEENKQ